MAASKPSEEYLARQRRTAYKNNTFNLVVNYPEKNMGLKKRHADM